MIKIMGGQVYTIAYQGNSMVCHHVKLIGSNLLLTMHHMLKLFRV